MIEFTLEKTGKKPKLKRPILVEGLPGIGNVARLAVDVLIEKLKAKKYATIYSSCFPNSVFINDDKLIEMPKVDIYYYQAKKKKERDFVFIIGDVQPADEDASYKFSKYLVDIAEDLGVSEIITLGGINSPAQSKQPPVYGAVTDKEFIPKLKKCGVRFDRKGSIVIVGAAGLMLSFAKMKSINGFSLLAETTGIQNSFGLPAAEAILTVLTKYLNINISLKDIRTDIRTMTTGIPSKKKKIERKLMSRFVNPESAPTHYIG